MSRRVSRMSPPRGCCCRPEIEMPNLIMLTMGRREHVGGPGLCGLLATITLAVAACGGGATGGSGSTQTGSDIVIGEALAATGQDAKEGGLTKQGVEIWLDWVNNVQHGITVKGVKHKIQVLVQDDGSKPDQSAT